MFTSFVEGGQLFSFVAGSMYIKPAGIIGVPHIHTLACYMRAVLTILKH